MLRHYLLLSMKVLLRRRFFTFISIFGISFTLMVLMVMTALADHRFGAGKPETRKALTLGVRNATMTGPENRSNSSPGLKLLDKYARDLPGVKVLSISTRANPVALYIAGERIERSLRQTDGEFWQIVDFDFLEGAPYTPADVANAQPLAVINRATRQRLFGGASAIGRFVEIGDRRLRVIGVVENVSAFYFDSFADIWTPYTALRSQAFRFELLGGYSALALADNAEALPGIREEFNRRMTAVEFDDPRVFNRIVAPFETEFEAFARASPLGDRESPEPQTLRAVAFIAIVATLFLVLPTVNLINLNISRILERSSEIGVRKAFGAAARTLVAQFVVENVVLTLAGAAVGLVLSGLVLRAINESGIAPYSQLAINLRVFGYAVLIAVGFGLLSGVYPAWRMARLHAVSALRGGSAR